MVFVWCFVVKTWLLDARFVVTKNMPLFQNLFLELFSACQREGLMVPVFSLTSSGWAMRLGPRTAILGRGPRTMATSSQAYRRRGGWDGVGRCVGRGGVVRRRAR